MSNNTNSKSPFLLYLIITAALAFVLVQVDSISYLGSTERYIATNEPIADFVANLGLQVEQGIFSTSYLILIPSSLYGVMFALAIIFGVLTLKGLLDTKRS